MFTIIDASSIFVNDRKHYRCMVRAWLAADANGSFSLDASGAFAVQYAVRFGWR